MNITELTNLYINKNLTAREIAVRIGKTKKAVQHMVSVAGLRKQVPVTWNQELIDSSCPVFNYLMGLAATDGCVDSDASVKGNQTFSQR